MLVIGYLKKDGSSADLRRRKKIVEWTERRGLFLQGLYEDEPCAAWKSHTLGGLMKVLDSELPVVVFDEADLENPKLNWSVKETLEKAGRRLILVGQRKVKPDPSSEPKEPIPAKEVVERLVKGRRKAVKAGSYGAGPAPYGYQRDYDHEPFPLLVPHPEEALVVKTIFREYLNLRSMARLAKWLDEEGYRTRRGSKFSRAGVSWILKNKVYVGRVKIGEVDAKGTHEGLVSWVSFNRAKNLMRENNKRGDHA